MSAYLTYMERLEIEAGLKEHKTFGEIAKQIEKDRTTVAKEVKRNAVEKKIGSSRYPYNCCIHRYDCKNKDICKSECTRKSANSCRYCSHCNTKCNDFKEEICIGIKKAPYVCNGCLEREKCTLKKKIYHASVAQNLAEISISNARRGKLSNDQEVMRLKNIIAPQIEKGKTVHQVYEKFKDELMCSEKTIYNYIEGGAFGVRNIVLPRNKKRRLNKNEITVDKRCRNGRTYEDFKKYMEKNSDLSYVQMDLIVSKKGGKVFLTIHFVETSLMVSFLLETCTSKDVNGIFKNLRNKLGSKLYKELFPVILTDNRSEFSNPKEIEYDERGMPMSRVFYFDEGIGYQKSKMNENHELIRKILPNGSSFDWLTQEKLNKMINHINSYKRKKLKNKSPYEVFQFYYGEEVLAKLGCSCISPNQVIINPSLLK